MENTITIHSDNTGTYFGALASKYSYTPELRAKLDELYTVAGRSTNRAFVLEGTIVRAAQSTKESAIQYMTDKTVLVEVEILEPTPEQLAQAAQAWAFLPFRKCFIALKQGEEMQIILKPTAHYAGKLARNGWTVRELHRS
jgi:hypothetical protein